MSDSLPKLRVANVGYLNSAPYRALAKLNFVEYRELEPSECARRLHRGTSDLACIPVSECFMDGGYSALPFGIVARGPVESVLLYSAKPINELNTILIDETSHASVSLLRVLLPSLGFSASKNPSLLRLPRGEIAKRIAGDIGGLIIGDLDPALRNSFDYCLDLAQSWFELTGKPFVFAIWTMRPGALNPQRQRDLFEAFAQAEANKVIYAREWAEEHNFDKALAVQYITERISFAVDSEAVDGLATFYAKGRTAGIFPSTDLNALVPGAFHGNLIRTEQLDNRRYIAETSSHSGRLSISQAERLAESSSLADIAILSSIRSGTLSANPLHNPVHTIYFSSPNEDFRSSRFRPSTSATLGVSLLPKEEVELMLSAAIEDNARELCIKGELTPELTLEYIEELLQWLTSSYKVIISGFSANQVATFASRSNLSLETTLQRLQIAGLSILCDEVSSEIIADTALAPFLIHQTAHRTGLRSAVTFKHSDSVSTHTQLLTLHYLRNLQDETKGFCRLEVSPAAASSLSPHPSLINFLKFHAAAALFLDNVPLSAGASADSALATAQLSLLAGAAEISQLPTPSRLGNFSADYNARSMDLVAATVSGLQF